MGNQAIAAMSVKRHSRKKQLLNIFFCIPLAASFPRLTFAARFLKTVGMNVFSAYSIPIQGLKVGVHQYQYFIDGAFFRHFEDSPVEAVAINFEVTLEKRSDMFLVNFVLQGTLGAICDRCTAAIDLPINGRWELIVKYGEAEDVEENDEVVFIPREVSHLNLAKYLYEFTVLALPITNTFDCQSLAEPPCNWEILKFLKTEEEESQSSTAIWDALRDLHKDN